MQHTLTFESVAFVLENINKYSFLVIQLYIKVPAAYLELKKHLHIHMFCQFFPPPSMVSNISNQI